MLLERLFERVLWLSRLVVVIPVVASIALACAAFYLGTVDVVYVVAHVGSYADLAASAGTRATTRAALLGRIITAVDTYLLAAVLLIFALGLYRLFIRKIEAAERAEFAPHLLRIESVDDLKDRLAKVVLLVLIVEFLQYALGTHYTSALDLLYLAIGIALIGVGLYLTSTH
jgi:uncharacterized membrane protein YqhA